MSIPSAAAAQPAPMRWAMLITLLGGCTTGAGGPPAPPATPPPFCTRTLGVAECFADPAALPDHPPGLADGPTQLTPEQARDKAKWWRF